MAAIDVREHVTGKLLDKLEESRFLHVPLMNRVESRLGTRDELERYIEILTVKLEETDYRSESLTDRLDRMVSKLERLERREAAAD
jgi:hypothetical protein